MKILGERALAGGGDAQKLAETERALRSGKGVAFDDLEAEMQAKLEAEREKRVQHLQQIGVRRIAQMGLAKGWTAWHDNYEEYQYKKRLLKGGQCVSE